MTGFDNDDAVAFANPILETFDDEADAMERGKDATVCLTHLFVKTLPQPAHPARRRSACGCVSSAPSQSAHLHTDLAERGGRSACSGCQRLRLATASCTASCLVMSAADQTL